MSSDVRGESAALGPIMSGTGNTAVAHGKELLAFAEGVVANGDLDGARAALLKRIGPEGLVDAAAIVAGFDATDRIADATGTDNKVCAIDETWSGLRLVYRISDRPRSRSRGAS